MQAEQRGSKPTRRGYHWLIGISPDDAAERALISGPNARPLTPRSLIDNVSHMYFPKTSSPAVPPTTACTSKLPEPGSKYARIVVMIFLSSCPATPISEPL